MPTIRKFYLRLIEKGPDSLFGQVVFVGLWPLSCLYGLGVWLRLRAYSLGLKKTYHASVPVLSVGNLSVGGTGKTPMADFLAKWMVQHNVPAAIVSRGYGGNYSASVVRVKPSGKAATSSAECGDEPFLLARRNPSVPVFVARQRALGVEAAEKAGAKLIILDDGFQHRAVYRDLDIVLLDSQKPFGNGHLLPAGQLREPQSALQRSHLIVMTRTQSDKNNASMMSKPTMYCRHLMSETLMSLSGDVVNWEALAGKSCVAFAGIARPDEFFADLKTRNLTLIDEIPLADHQVYDAELVQRLARAGQVCDALITTEKDAVKFSGTEFPVPCYQVGVELVFEDTSLLDPLLQELIAKDSARG
ncbi:MAG: tetraacyldisaccharide 4'-kinase [Deltaproteobacteria bacterium]|nr:MAG: tetraacyldisaccharide 4'-kinase [Deltaproteobacteria bacterium]